MPEEEPTPWEIWRNITRLSGEFDSYRLSRDRLAGEYIRRDLFEENRKATGQRIGVTEVDVAHMSTRVDQAFDKVHHLEETIDKRFRASINLIAASFVFPVIVAMFVFAIKLAVT